MWWKRKKIQVIRMGPMIQQMVKQCDKCNGSGYSIKNEDKCEICSGSGFTKK